MKDIPEGRKMQDKIETLGKSLIHHGKISNRVYILKLHPEDYSKIIPETEALALEKGYTKVFGKIPTEVLPLFAANSYISEAYIPQFFKNKTDGIFVSKFFDENRQRVNQTELENFYRILTSTEKKNKLKNKHSLKYVLKKLGVEEVEEISGVLKKGFTTYPFPVHDPNYILNTMQGDETQYFGIKNGTELIGVSTAETDIINKNAEMTDFAVLPEYRGQSLAFRLLVKMEQEMKITGIKTAYTIARLKEAGMCKTFLKSGYTYTGTLVNNTNIGGGIESMNVFYKHL